MATSEEQRAIRLPGLHELRPSADYSYYTAEEMREYATAAVEADRQQAPQERADERHLRRLLCACVAGPTAYMDDGEASDCSEQPHIDFLLDSPSQIEQALHDRAINRAALAANPQRINEKEDRNGHKE